jgi:hypothetical protein
MLSEAKHLEQGEQDSSVVASKTRLAQSDIKANCGGAECLMN